ncbi:MAG: hypothetical protein ACTS73_09945 [Arsenophonus sp. NEOnobi-MAG3]
MVKTQVMVPAVFNDTCYVYFLADRLYNLVRQDDIAFACWYYRYH